jgi:hypothetical protein
MIMMMKSITGALESNKYVTLTFALNGGQLQIVASARSDKGVNTLPVNVLAGLDDAENVLVKVFGESLGQGAQKSRTKRRRKHRKRPQSRTRWKKPEQTKLPWSRKHT